MKKENRYKEGEIVYAKLFPEVKLVIRRYVDRVYYCQVEAQREQKERVYYDRELI